MSRVLGLRKAVFLVGTAVLSMALLVGFFTFSSVGSAQARGRTLFVGLTAGSDTGCAHPGFTSVQGAVNAAHAGDTVYLCGANSYSGLVIINKSITLTGDKGATITPPGLYETNVALLPPQFAADNLFAPQALVIVWGAHVNATISRLTLAGPLPGNGNCAEQEFGALVIAGASATFSRDKVLNIADTNSSLYGCQFGVAIEVGREYWPTADFSNFLVENFVGHANITDTTVSGYQKNGITVDGPGSSAQVKENTITGAGRTGMGQSIAQNGIQISRGARGEASNNRVSDNSYTGSAPDASSTGILIYGGCGDPLVTNVEVEDNALFNNDIGVALLNYSADCSGAAATPTRDKATGNYVRNDAVTNASAETLNSVNYSGYQAGIEDVGNRDQIIDNTIAGAGYAPQTTAGGVFVLPIDTTSFPTIDPTVHDNRIHV